MQSDLPISSVHQIVKRSGKDIPVIALLEVLDNDSVSEALDCGATNITTGNIKEQLCNEVINIFNNLTARRKLRQYEADLNDAEKRCASLLDSSKDAIAYIHDGMHVYTNNAYLDFFEYNDAEEMEVTPFLNLVTKEQVPETKKLLRDIAMGKIPDNDIDMKLKTDKGDVIEVIVSLDKARVDGEPCVQFLVQRPKVNLAAEKELQDIKSKDLLTGFYNRSYFSKDLSDKVNEVKSGKTSGYSVMYIQLDNHKELEKDLGKGNLDLLVADMAPFIQEILGENHIFARYDDTTFIVTLKGEIEQAVQLAQHLTIKISDHLFNAGEKTLNCTISVGLTQLIEKTSSANEIIKILGNEIIKSIENGGNQVSTFDPAEEEKKARAANQKWIDLISNGIQNNQFILHYQPVISLHGDETEHYDCLVRLKDGDKLIMPAEFIGIAKRHGLIIDIDKNVIRNAIIAIKESTKKVALLVKVSTDTLSNASFPVWLAKTLKEHGVSGEFIIFETPESELVSDSKHIKPVINSVKGLNCKFAIEKFGSGLNSFSLLKHYPIDFIKIDSTFMEEFSNNKDNQEKVKEIIDNAHAQNKMVICEFVEDAAAMSILWKFSANYVQGNFLAPASEKMSQES
jgi:diguanylate cyclase (GGDEF)-like protein/PAS domain S-box-containing protein